MFIGFVQDRMEDIMTQSEKALKLHEEWNGKITTTPKCEVKSRDDLAIDYSPVV